MPYRFIIHHDLKLAYKKVWGSYTDDESDAAMDEWSRLYHAENLPGYNELHDLTTVTEYRVTPIKMKVRAQTTRKQREDEAKPPKRVAYVMPTDLGYGTARIYQAMLLTSGEDFKVFRRMEDAAEFLSLKAAALQRILEEVTE